jgi:ferredoxin--NADP+ reductase
VQDVWKGEALAQAWGSRRTPEDTHVFLCGSPHMIDDMATLLAADGFREHSDEAPGQIHVERYWHASAATSHAHGKVHA